MLTPENNQARHLHEQYHQNSNDFKDILDVWWKYEEIAIAF